MMVKLQKIILVVNPSVFEEQPLYTRKWLRRLDITLSDGKYKP